MIIYLLSIFLLSNSDPIILQFSETGGRDVYKDGDYYGRKIYIYQSGLIKKYHIIYYEAEKEIITKDSLIITKEIERDEIEKMEEIIYESDFLNYPEYIPDGDWSKIRCMTPASGLRINYSSVSKGIKKNVYATMNCERKYYPEDFFGFLSKIRGFINKQLN